jgi:hypothetical protein
MARHPQGYRPDYHRHQINNRHLKDAPILPQASSGTGYLRKNIIGSRILVIPQQFVQKKWWKDCGNPGKLKHE